jgi:anti-sigma factor RsiW
VDRLTAEDFANGPCSSSNGPAADALASYVIGALSEAEAEKLEAHVYACDACSEALAREARLERAFELMAEDMVPEPLVLERPRLEQPLPVAARVLGRGRWGGVVGAVAIAASALLWLGPGHGRTWPTTEVGSTAHGSGGTNLDAPDAHATESLQDADAQAQILFARDLDGG